MLGEQRPNGHFRLSGREAGHVGEAIGAQLDGPVPLDSVLAAELWERLRFRALRRLLSAIDEAQVEGLSRLNNWSLVEGLALAEQVARQPVTRLQGRASGPGQRRQHDGAQCESRNVSVAQSHAPHARGD
jgi:hypothetical protein